MIYLDYNATTPVAPEVARAMQPFLGPEFGNPSCDYPLGLRAREAMHQARREVAALLNCAPEEVVFTSGATEANNLVLKGVALSRGSGRIITAATEHPAVLAPCRWLASLGFGLTVLPVDSQGLVDPEAVRRALTPDTILISIMHANNETGALAPLPRSPPLPGRPACRCIPTRPRAWARSGWTWRNWGWIFSPWRGTNSTPPKGSGPCTCAGAGS